MPSFHAIPQALSDSDSPASYPRLTLKQLWWRCGWRLLRWMRLTRLEVLLLLLLLMLDHVRLRLVREMWRLLL